MSSCRKSVATDSLNTRQGRTGVVLLQNLNTQHEGLGWKPSPCCDCSLSLLDRDCINNNCDWRTQMPSIQSARAIQREQSQQGLGFQPSPSRWVFREFAATQNRHVQQCSHTQKIDKIHLVELNPSIFSKWRLWHFKMAIIEDMATKLARIIWT